MGTWKDCSGSINIQDEHYTEVSHMNSVITIYYNMDRFDWIKNILKTDYIISKIRTAKHNVTFIIL